MRVKSVSISDNEDVYDLTVPDTSCFYANDVLVHNCFEIGMLPHYEGESGWQLCNLTEINGEATKTVEDFMAACECAATLGTLQAGYTDFKFVSPVTRKITEREALLGVSITGWLSNPEILLNPDTQRLGAAIVQKTNETVAGLIGINPAARLTTVKPSGNASVLLGTTSALSGEHSERYIRNVQMTVDQPVAQVIRESNPYMVESSTWSAGDTDCVISFPVIGSGRGILKKDNTGVNMLARVRQVQENWIEAGTVVERCVDPNLRHNVSTTCVVCDDEWEDVSDYVLQHRNSFAALSFIPDTGDRDYNQAPFVAIPSTEEIVSRYGRAALFMSGLIVDLYHGFANPWEACDAAVRDRYDDGELGDLRADWIRRFHKFTDNYFDGERRMTELCLKDVFLLHRWTKIQTDFWPVDIEQESISMRQVAVEPGSLTADACHGGSCEI